MSLLYLKTKVHLFTEVHLIDNSNILAMLVIVLEKSIVVSKNEKLPKWAAEIIAFVEKL